MLLKNLLALVPLVSCDWDGTSEPARKVTINLLQFDPIFLGLISLFGLV